MQEENKSQQDELPPSLLKKRKVIPVESQSPPLKKQQPCPQLSKKNLEKCGLKKFRKVFKGASPNEFRTFAKIAKKSLETISILKQVTAEQGYLYWDMATILKRITYIEDIENTRKIILSWQNQGPFSNAMSDQRSYLKRRDNFIGDAVKFLDKYRETISNPPSLEEADQLTEEELEGSAHENDSKDKTIKKNLALGFIELITHIKITQKEFNTLIYLSVYSNLGTDLRTDGFPPIIPGGRFYKKTIDESLLRTLLNSITPERVSSLFPLKEIEGPRNNLKKAAKNILEKLKDYFLKNGWLEEDFNPNNWGVTNPYSFQTSREASLMEATSLREIRIANLPSNPDSAPVEALLSLSNSLPNVSSHSELNSTVSDSFTEFKRQPIDSETSSPSSSSLENKLAIPQVGEFTVNQINQVADLLVRGLNDEMDCYKKLGAAIMAMEIVNQQRYQDPEKTKLHQTIFMALNQLQNHNNLKINNVSSTYSSLSNAKDQSLTQTRVVFFPPEKPAAVLHDSSTILSPANK